MATGRIPINGTAAIQSTIVDAKGDLIVATGSDAVSRLAVGANGTTLVADSSTATGLAYAAPAGGMTLLSTTTLSGASTTISTINQSFKNLEIIISAVNLTNASSLRIAPNGTTNISDIAIARIINGSASVSGENGNYITPVSNMGDGNTQNAFSLTIFNYANTSHRKSFDFKGRFRGSSVDIGFNAGGGINTASAISSLVFDISSGTFSAGQVLIYGVK